MKKVFVILFLFSSLIIGQDASIDSTAQNAIVEDSVDIRSLVQEQIQKALQKQSVSVVTPVDKVIQTEKPTVANKQNEQLSEFGVFTNLIWDQPIQYKIFELGSILIVGFVSFRRVVQTVKKKSLNALKAKISLLRNEKVLTKLDPKLQLVRKQLSNNDSIFNKSEKQISKAAKDLKISKGELLLAARLRLFEVGKM